MNKIYLAARHTVAGLLLCCAQQAAALTFALPNDHDNVVGKVYHITTKPGDTFSKIGRRYNVGYYSLVEANPGLNPQYIEAGTKLTVPARFVLPATAKTGIVINLAELRLYYYPANKREVITYPIGIGREGWGTPVGLTHIGVKTKDPTWVAPESIIKDRAKDGVILPKSIPPGPDNPLGGYRMRLANTTYLIHGSNDPTGVGRRSSSGCIRMLPEDVERLFDEVKPGTPVRIINAPYKLGWSNDKLLLEAHLPLEEQLEKYQKDTAPLANLISKTLELRPADIDWDVARNIAQQQSGIPHPIGIATGPWNITALAKNSSEAVKARPKKAKKTTKKYA